MTQITRHTLTDTEIQCGVTLEQVAEQLPRVLLRDGRAVLPAELGPALAGSVARAALGVDALYAGHNTLGHPVYRPRIQ